MGDRINFSVELLYNETAPTNGWRSSFRNFRNYPLQKTTIVKVKASVDFKPINASIPLFAGFPHSVFSLNNRASCTQLNTVQHHYDIRLDGMMPNCTIYIAYNSLYC